MSLINILRHIKTLRMFSGGTLSIHSLEKAKQKKHCQDEQPGMDEIIRASDILWEKNLNFVGFSGANSWKNQPMSRDFSGKKSNFEGFSRGKFLEKSADFTGNFRENLRQEAISKKQPISLDFFRQILLKSTQCSRRYDQRCLTFF